MNSMENQAETCPIELKNELWKVKTTNLKETSMVQDQVLSTSSYAEQYIPNTTALGEVLLRFAQTTPRNTQPAANQTWEYVNNSYPWYIHMILCTGILLAWWFGMIYLYTFVSCQYQQCGTALLLLTTSALVYLFCSFLLMRIPLTANFGYNLWWRHFSHDSHTEFMQSVLEVCTWIALIVGIFTITQNPIISAFLGGVSGICVVALGDFLMVYIRVHSDYLKEEEQPLGLKYTLTTVCLGYAFLGFVRLVSNFLLDDSQSQSMILQYLLTILVGISLVVISELLILYTPTRHAGIILQSRVIHAKSNWSSHPIRSFLELSFVFTVTVVLNDYLNDMLMALQGGTLLCTIFILLGEFYFYPTKSHAHDIPQEHWIKVLPIVTLGGFTTFHICRTLYRHDQLVLPTINLVLLASMSKLFRIRLVWSRFVHVIENLRANTLRTTLELTAHCLYIYCVQYMPLSTWSKVLGSVLFDLSIVHVQEIGPPIWNAISYIQYAPSWSIEIELKDKRPSFSASDVALRVTRRLIWDIEELAHEAQLPTNCYVVPMYVILNFLISMIVPLAGVRYGCLLSARIVGIVATILISIFIALCCGVIISLITCSSHAKFRLLRRLLVYSIQQQCALYPLQVFVQVVVCFGVLIGTYAISGIWSYSLVLASCSVICVLSGSRFVMKKISHANDHLHATCAVVFFVALLSYAVGLCLFFIYFYIHRIEIAFCLATLSGVIFVACSELFILWKPTRIAGYILQTRVTNCCENWRLEPLRSFLELLVWISVTYGTFALYQDVIVALHLGTLSGVVVTLAGEVFRNRWLFQQPVDVKQRPKVLPLLLFFAYIGAGTFQWIFEHLRSLEVTVALATVAGIIFLCVADVLAMWQPTRWAGVILQDRFLNASEHWKVYPVRSFVEVGCFLGVIYGSHAIYGDLSVAVQCGTLSGMLVTLIGEQLKSQRKQDTEVEEKKSQILPFPIISVLGFVGCVAFNTIYTHLRSIEMAFVLATASGVVFAVLGDMFVIWAPTRYVGTILQARILHFTRDLRSWRCIWELSLSTIALYVSYGYMRRGDLLVAIQSCTFTGILVCVLDEFVVEKIQTYKQNIVQQGKWHAQEQSALLGMPYGILFETARFLTPEELLVTRTTCHKVNNLLRAESKRFWLQATLRRQFGLARRNSRAGSSHRSLIYEAWKAIMPKIFGPREPSTILTAKMGHNRALKWVFVNADWIRRQNMPRRPSNEKFVELDPSDVGFEVFRHMPDKDLLGIQVSIDDTSLGTAHLTVPGQVYSQIQADPFSFVVSETLYEVESLTNWHLCIVAFVALVVVVLGQFTAETLVLNSY